MKHTKTTLVGVALLSALSSPVLAATDAGVDALPSRAPSAEPAAVQPDATVPGETPVAAAEPAEPAAEPKAGDLIGDTVSAAQAGQWIAVIGGGLALFVLGLRAFLVLILKLKWFGTKPGGYVLNFGSAFLLGVGGAMLESNSFAFGLLLTSLTLALAASGGYTGAKDFVAWVSKKIGAAA